MSGKFGIMALALALLTGLLGGAARADSLFNLIAPNGGEKELVIWTPQITFTRDVASSGDAESIGTFTITTYPKPNIDNYKTTGNLKDPVLFPTKTDNIGTISPFTALTISGTIDVTRSGSSYNVSFGGATTMDIEGKILGTTPVIDFNQSTDMSGYAVNLDGVSNEPLAFMFARQTSGYYTNSDEGYIVAQLRSASSPNTNPFSVDNFFLPTGGNSYVWDGGNYKIDLFAEPVPLPAPFWLGTILLAGFAGVAHKMRCRRA